MNKINDKTIRLKYVRYLEKFHRRSIALLKHNSFDINIYIKNMNRHYDDLKKIPSIRLNNEYFQMLENYINLTLYYISNHKDDFTKAQKDLLYRSNQLHKEKNKTNYKKDKHIKRSFTDGY
jgi:hypothetical protein